MLKLAVALSLLLAQTPAQVVPTTDMKRAIQHDKKGWTAFDARDFDHASESFRAALQIWSDYPDALYGLGKAQIALGHAEDAVWTLERCRLAYVGEGTKVADARLAEWQARQDRLRELRARQNAPAVGGPTGAAATAQSTALAQEIRSLEKEHEAEPMAGEAGAIPPAVLLSLGSAYFHVGRLPDAERTFSEAIKIDPKFGEAYSNLALVYLQTGRPQEALKQVEIAEELKFKINPELKRQIREALARSR